jgi:hypothetical protein
MQGDLHHVPGLFHHALDFVAYGAFEPSAPGDVLQLGKQPGNAVPVPGAATLVDGEYIHTANISD